MMLQAGKQAIAIHILTYNSRSKDNQRVKFGQLIEYSIKKIFLEKLYPNCGWETSPKPFSKKAFIPSWRLSKYIETKVQTTGFYFI